MIIWCLLLVLLGLFGVLQDINVIQGLGEPYRITNVLMIMVALGILVRIRYKQIHGEREKLQAKIRELQGDTPSVPDQAEE